MPTLNDTRVRVDGLSNITATARGPASGRRPNRSAFSSSARSSTSTSSAGLEVVVAQEVPGHQPAAGSARRPRPAPRPSSSTAPRRPRPRSTISGGASRSTSGLDRVDQQAARPGRRRSTAAGDSPASARRPTTARCRAPRRPAGCPAARRPGRQRRAHRAHAGQQVRRCSIVSSTASAAAQQTGLPPKVLPWRPGGEQPGRRAEADAGADRQAAAQPLGQRQDVRHARPAAMLANHWPVRPMPLCTSSITSSAPARSQISRAAAR